MLPLIAFTTFNSMFRKSRRFMMLFAFLPLAGMSQQYTTEEFHQNISKARSDSERIQRMGELTRYYYANKEFGKADSLFERQIILSEATLKKHLVLKTYFDNTSFLIPSSESRDRLKSVKAYLVRALDFARAADLTEFVALAYSHTAAVNLADGEHNEAFRNANLAYTTSLNTLNDSVKVICAIQLGEVYQDKSDILFAYKIFTNAQNIAIQSEKESLLPVVYTAMANLYKKFGKYFEAKKYVNQSLAINKKQNNLVAQIYDNILLSKLSNYIAGKQYLEEAIRLAALTNNVPLRIEAEKILFFHMTQEEKPATTLAFLNTHPEIRNVFINTGPSYLDWMMAEVYLYGGKPDSAYYFFKKAEQDFNTGYDLTTRKGFFEEFAYCNKVLDRIPTAIFYYEKTFQLAQASSDLRRLQTTSAELKKLYEKQNNYKQAYHFSSLSTHYKDSVDQLGRDRDLALLEIESVKKAEQRESEIANQKKQRKYNLQYMLITIIVAVAFLLLIMIGMFSVSTTVIRIMGFLSLIFFFEFIILLLDTWIHHLTHGEPWKIWLIKIGIISILLPVHHYIEHRLIRYLLSRHLITIRGRLSLSKLFRKKDAKIKATASDTTATEYISDQSQAAGGGQSVPISK